MDGKHEDEIIAATFAKYMQTEDPTWPLLLPMVKSAVRGMDATTAAAQLAGECHSPSLPSRVPPSEAGQRGYWCQ